jgi:hypothetical protein
MNWEGESKKNPYEKHNAKSEPFQKRTDIRTLILSLKEMSTNKNQSTDSSWHYRIKNFSIMRIS